MAKPLKIIKWREALPRIVVDFVLIHAAMLLAIFISLSYQSQMGSESYGTMLKLSGDITSSRFCLFRPCSLSCSS